MKRLLVTTLLLLMSMPSIAEGPCGFGSWGAQYFWRVNEGRCKQVTYLVTCGGLLGNSIVSRQAIAITYICHQL
jgi:hypothetical protein